MRYKVQKSIMPGQITVHRDYIYRAEKRSKFFPCIDQCECSMPHFSTATGCSGYCHRWSNGGEIVFKRLDAVPDNEIIVETGFGRMCRLSHMAPTEQEGEQQ